MTTYRDDLEAAQLRADDLQRELDALRDRNQRLAAELGGDSAEATTNARRLAAAVAREQAEQRLREQANLDEHAARERAKADRVRGQDASMEQAQPMTAERDGLEAAQVRASDLEREAEQLRKRNVDPAASEEARKPSKLAAAMAASAKACFIMAIVAVGGSTHSSIHRAPNPTLALIFLAVGAVCWCCSGFRPLWK